MNCELSSSIHNGSIMDYGKFKVIYDDMGITNNVSDRAWNLLTELMNENREELLSESTNLDEWIACVLYIAVVNIRHESGTSEIMTNPEQPVVGATDILLKTQTSILVLFKRMKVIRECRQMTRVLEENLISLERKYCITCPIFNKYEKMFADVFLETGESDFKYRSCWVLFVNLKGTHCVEHTELVSAFELMVCCFIYTMRRTPSFHLKPPYDTIATQPGDSPFINEICSTYGVPVEDIPNLLNSVVEPIISNLPHKQGNLLMDKLIDLYRDEYRRIGDIDELLFLERSTILAAPVSNGHKRETEENMDVQVTSQMTPPQTPVTAALRTVQNLKVLLHNSPDGPSKKLEEYFLKCSANPANAVLDRLNNLRDVFVQRFIVVTHQNQKQMAQQRYQLSVRLYYRVLEALLISEEERLSVQDFSHLLNNSTFHTCLLACAVEVVLVTYEHMWMPAGPSMMAFPWILSVFEIHGYDFYKVLETFIKAEPNLTKDIVRHLQSVETKILESMAWESGSPLYETLRRAESVRLSAPPPSPRSFQNSSAPDTSAAQLYLSPVRRPMTTDAISELTNTLGSMEPPQSPVPKRKSQSLQLFYNKVSKLAYFRLKTLCEFLGIQNDLQLNIWTCVQHVISQKSEMMRDRHLDQIILCCIYSICKVRESEIKFKTIVSMYKNLPHASTQVYKNTLIAENRYDSIIGFYNQIFMHNLKSYILRFASPRQAPSMSPVPNSVPSPITKSPAYKLPGWNNFFVSPLKNSPFKCPLSPNQMTPRSRQLYSFGESLRGETGSAEKLRAINESMRASKHGLTSPMTSPKSQPRSQKCLRFDTSPGEENANSSPTTTFMPVRRVSRSKVALSFDDPAEK